eukprot:scaffold44188_cov63-Phaeocystis_antarctica.AAC.1
MVAPSVGATAAARSIAAKAAAPAPWLQRLAPAVSGLVRTAAVAVALPVVHVEVFESSGLCPANT